MVELPSDPRRGSGGKLAAVLDHTLRLGDSATQEKVIAAHKARGLTPPEHLVDPPQIELRFLVYWEAFQDLQTERVNPRQTIPVTKIIDYARRYGLDPDTLKRIVWKTDQVLIEHWRGVDAAEKAQADAQASNKPTLSGART
jgi:hypothetical protein